MLFGTEEGVPNSTLGKKVEKGTWVHQAKGGLCLPSLPLLAPKLPLTCVHIHSKSREREGSSSSKSTVLTLLTLFRFLLKSPPQRSLPWSPHLEYQSLSISPFASTFSHDLPLDCIFVFLFVVSFCSLNVSSTKAIVYFVHYCILYVWYIFNEWKKGK